MKTAQKIASVISTTFAYLFTATSIYAQSNPLLKPPSGSVGAGTKIENVPQLVIQYIFYLAIFLAVVYLMFGGIKLITSKGDKVAVESARKHITYAIVGLVVVIGTFFILNMLFNILGVDNPLNKSFELPTLKNINR